MIQKIVDALINKQLKNYEMTNEEEKIYRYGYILLCEVILNLIIAVLIGILFSKTKEVMFFLCIYIPLRSFCGGWHADEVWKCTVVSNVILLLLIYSIENVVNYFSIRVMLVIFFLNMFFILFKAPVETKMKKISKNEKQIYKRKIVLILVLHTIIMIIISRLALIELVFSLMLVYIIQIMFLLLEIVMQEIEKNREKYRNN